MQWEKLERATMREKLLLSLNQKDQFNLILSTKSHIQAISTAAVPRPTATAWQRALDFRASHHLRGAELIFRRRFMKLCRSPCIGWVWSSYLVAS